MQKLIEKSCDKKVVFLENINGINSVKDLSTKKLCIIKTNFHDLNLLKGLSKKYPKLEVWLTSERISRKEILTANRFGIKTVIPYPFDTKIVSNFFKKKAKTEQETPVCACHSWLKGLKVMIVDDNRQNVELLAETLASSGLDITTFINPHDAAEAVKKEKFDLFLLDIMMPEVSGFDLAKIIKNSELNDTSLIMFISALSDSDTKIQGYELGSCAYIEKPFDIKVVRSQIFNSLKTKCLNDAINSRKDDFLAMVAHDLKSPVNSEIAALDLLLRSYENTKDDFKKDIVCDISGATKYMKNLIDNVLNKYKLDNSGTVLNKAKHSLNLLIIESIEETKYLMLEKRQKAVFQNKTRKCSAMIDFLEIKRVLHNLIMNAIENSPKDTVIEMELSENKKYFVFSIRNETNGYTKINPDEIFEKFMSYAVEQKRVGSGLGLYISKRIIEAHEGTIKVDVKNPKYVRFVFTLPK